MHKINSQAVENQITKLVSVAQNEGNQDVRKKATDMLWELCGDFILGVTTKNSIKIDSDHQLHGKSFAERSNTLMGICYELFLNCIEKFNPIFGVPFLAFVAEESRRLMLTEKRNNSRRSKKMNVVCLSDIDKCSEDDEGGISSYLYNNDINPFTHEVNSFEAEMERESMENAVRGALQTKPELLHVFEIMQTVVDDGEKPSRANVAEKMGCTPQNAQYHIKKMCDLLVKRGLIHDFHLLMAA